MTLMKSHKLLIVIERGPLLAIVEQMCGGGGAALDLTGLTSSPCNATPSPPPPHLIGPLADLASDSRCC